MLRYAHALWDAFFPTRPVYPVLLAGHGDAPPIESTDELEAQLRRRYRVFTYRDAFEGLTAECRTLHTDQGWGCLLRTTQMLLAHFLLRYADADMAARRAARDAAANNNNNSSTSSSRVRGGDGRRRGDGSRPRACLPAPSSPAASAAAGDKNDDDNRNKNKNDDMCSVACDGDDDFPWRLFCDCSSASSPFSLHNMVRSVYGSRAFRPEYWSPSQGCEALRRTMQIAMDAHALRTRVTVLVANNGCIFHADVVRALRAATPAPRRRRRRCRCRARHCDDDNVDNDTCACARDGDARRAVLLLLTPVRVSAAAQLTQEAYLQLEYLLEQPSCLGMVGGVPGRSYFFFAHNQTQLLYLDPHQSTQPALHRHSDGAARRLLVPSRDDVRCVHWSRVDTSLFLAFALRHVREWRQLRERLRGVRFLNVDDSGSGDGDGAHTAQLHTAVAAASVCVLSSSSSSASSLSSSSLSLSSSSAVEQAAHVRCRGGAHDDNKDTMTTTTTTKGTCTNDSWHMLDDGGGSSGAALRHDAH